MSTNVTQTDFQEYNSKPFLLPPTSRLEDRRRKRRLAKFMKRAKQLGSTRDVEAIVDAVYDSHSSKSGMTNGRVATQQRKFVRL